MECINVIVPAPLIEEVADFVTTYKLANEIVGVSSKDDIHLRILYPREQTILVIVICVVIEFIREMNVLLERSLRREEERKKAFWSQLSHYLYNGKNTDVASDMPKTQNDKQNR